MKIFFALASIFLCVLLVKGDDDVNFSVSLWTGDDMSSTNSKCLDVPAGSSVYDALMLAGEQDSNYVIGTSPRGDRHYIYQIGEDKEDRNECVFWMYYVLKRQPNNNKPPTGQLLSQIGVDDTIVEGGKHYLFWLRTHPTLKC